MHPDPSPAPARPLCLVLAAILLAAVACDDAPTSPAPSATSSAEVDAGTSRRPDVVWVVLDAAGARHFSFLGAPRQTTPAISALARDPKSRVFERAYSQWPSTLGSTASFLTGLYPPPDQIPNGFAAPTIALQLSEAGWRTAAFSENPFVARGYGFARGFDLFDEVPPQEPEAHAIVSQSRRDTARTIDRAVEWLSVDGGEPSFVYLHLLPPHAPFDAPAPFAGRFRSSDYRGPFDGRVPLIADVFFGKASASEEDLVQLSDLYDENLSFVDYHVGRLLDWLRDQERLDRTLFILSADHGEAFGEHGAFLHGTSLHDEQIHVPLVVRFPAEVPVGSRRVAQPVELVDVVPTILDVVGLPDRALPGTSLRRRSEGDPARPGLARAWLARKDERWRMGVAGDTKWIVRKGEAPVLYDLRSDPDELAPRPLARGEVLVGADREAPTVEWNTVRIDRRVAKQLEALGYGDGSTEPSPAAGDD